MVLYSFVLERPDTGQQIIHYLNNSFLSLSLSTTGEHKSSSDFLLLVYVSKGRAFDKKLQDLWKVTNQNIYCSFFFWRIKIACLFNHWKKTNNLLS